MGEYEGSDTGNWNVNVQYIQILAGHFYWIKQYKEISKFGTSDILDDFSINERMKATLRLKAMERLIYRLKELINDTKFAVQDKKAFEDHYANLKFYQSIVFPNVRKDIINGDKKEIGINNAVFDFLFEKLDKIDMEIKQPLNMNDILFNFKEKFSPKDHKKKMTDIFVEGG